MARPKAQPRGAKFLMLVRTRVPLNRPIPTERYGPADNDWEDFRAILANARGCKYTACGRVAEDPEKVLFIISNFTSFFSSSLFAAAVPYF
jgi:hypothetical protein